MQHNLDNTHTVYEARRTVSDAEIEKMYLNMSSGELLAAWDSGEIPRFILRTGLTDSDGYPIKFNYSGSKFLQN